MGMRLLKAHEPLCEIDPSRYEEETSLKQRLLIEAYSYYFRGGEGTMTAQWDVLELVTTNLAQSYPEQFQLRREGDDWHWRNRLTGGKATFRFGDSSTLPCEPLNWVGQQVQDDLVLLSADPSATFV